MRLYRRVARLAAAVELPLKQPANLQALELDTPIRQLGDELASLIGAIETALGKPRLLPPPVAVDASEMLDALKTFSELVAQDDMRSESYFSEHRAALDQALGSDIARQIEKHLGEFDFGAVQSCLAEAAAPQSDAASRA